MIFEKAVRPREKVCGKWTTEKAPINSRRLKLLLNYRGDTDLAVQPKIDLLSFQNTPDSLKRRFKAFERKPSLGVH